MKLIRKIIESNIKGVGIICTYQEPYLGILKNPNDKFYKLTDLISPDKEYLMAGLLDFKDISDLIKFHFSERLNVNNIDHQLINILLQKSFKGNPTLIIELVESLLEQKYIQYPANQLITTSDLDDMDKTGDWYSFVLPLRAERIIGSIIDGLPVKEIMLLKYACVIGNIFDLSTLTNICPFNNLNMGDLYSCLSKFEVFICH